MKRVLEEWSWPLGLGGAFTVMGLLTWYRKPTAADIQQWGPHPFINSPWTILVAAVGGLALGLAVHFVLRASSLSSVPEESEPPPED